MFYKISAGILVLIAQVGCQTVQEKQDYRNDAELGHYFNYEISGGEDTGLVRPNEYLRLFQDNRIEWKSDASPSDIRELASVTKVTWTPKTHQAVSDLQKQVSSMNLAVYESIMPPSEDRLTQGLPWFKDLLVEWSNKEPIRGVYNVDMPIYLLLIGSVTELYAVFRDDLELTQIERSKIDEFLRNQWRISDLAITNSCRYPRAPAIQGCASSTLKYAKYLAVAGKTLGDKELLDKSLWLTLLVLNNSRFDGSNIHDSQRGGMAKLYTLDGAKYMIQISRIFESIGVEFWEIQPDDQKPSTKQFVNFALDVIADDKLIKQYAKAMGRGSKGKDWQVQYSGGATVGQFVFEAKSFMRRFRPDLAYLINKPMTVRPIDANSAIHPEILEATIMTQ